MASIKISALGELELDRLSDTDVLIINDQDTTTQKITFKTIKEGLDRDARYFTGPVEFGNTVVFNGPLAGRNVYTKDETLNEITLALQPVQADLDIVEAQVDSLQLLSGVASGTVVYGTSQFHSANMKLSAQNYNTQSALVQLDKGAQDSNLAIIAVDTSVQNLATRVLALDSVIEPKGLAVTNEARISELETAVGMPGGSVIGGNTSNITANSTNIDNLAKQIGTFAGAGIVNDQLGVIDNVVNITSPAVNVIAALTELDAAVENVRMETCDTSASPRPQCG